MMSFLVENGQKKFVVFVFQLSRVLKCRVYEFISLFGQRIFPFDICIYYLEAIWLCRNESNE